MPEYPDRVGYEEATHCCAECNCELEHTGAGDGTQGPLACPDCAARDAEQDTELDKSENLHRQRFTLQQLGYRLVGIDADHYAVVGWRNPLLREQRRYWSPSDVNGGAWVLVPVGR